jgi:hypothetical protein
MAQRGKRMATLLLDKPHQRHDPMLEYHDTQHRSEYITIHRSSPCVLPTMHLAFRMDKVDNTLARPSVQGRTCHIPIVIRCI